MTSAKGVWPVVVPSPSGLRRPVRSAASLSNIDGLSTSRPRSSAVESYTIDFERPQSVSSTSTWLPVTPVDPWRPVTTLGFTRCHRVIELETEASRKNVLRAKSAPVGTPPASSRYQATNSRCTSSAAVAPFFLLSRGRANIFDRLRQKMESLQVDSMTSETANSETRDRLIERLHQEIDDLILAVEVEKLNHKETRQQNAELLAAKVKELKREQDEEMRRAEDDLDRKVNDLSKSYAVKIEECKRVGTETAEKLKLKIETLTSAFETYKKELREKMADEIEGQLETLHREHELSVHTETMALRSQIEAEKNVEKAEIERKFQEVCSQQKKEYQYDTEDSMVRFSQNTTDLEKLSYMQAKVKEVEKEIAETEAQCQMAIDRLDNSRLETAKLEAKLKEYEESFEDRVQCVHQKYCDEIDELKKLIESLQTCYLQKCETALDRQKLADVLLAQRVQTAKAALKSSLEERQRTAQRLTSSPPPLPPPVRPSSSPFKHRVGTVNEPGKFLKPVEITWQQLTV